MKIKLRDVFWKLETDKGGISVEVLCVLVPDFDRFQGG